MSVTAIANILVGPIAALLDKFIPDKDERERMAFEISTMAAKQSHEMTMAQLEVNKQEAAHKSLFVAGWRPFIGWSCGLSMASNFLLFPLVNMGLSIFQVLDHAGQLVQVPMIDLTVMMPVLLGMLGLGALRTAEKVKGVAREK
jgi:hypothetical protein